MDFEQIGMRIKACRKQKHLTQEKLAECLDVSSHYIYELERGVKTMSLYTLNDLSTCLEVSSDYLLYGKDNTDSNPIPEDALSVMIKDLPSQQRNRLADLLKAVSYTHLPHAMSFTSPRMPEIFSSFSCCFNIYSFAFNICIALSLFWNWRCV